MGPSLSLRAHIPGAVTLGCSLLTELGSSDVGARPSSPELTVPLGTAGNEFKRRERRELLGGDRTRSKDKVPGRAGGRARAEPPTPAAGWPGRPPKDSWVGKQGRRPAGQPQPDLAPRTGNCKASLGGERGEAFSLFRFRACLNSLAQKSSPLGACLFLPAPHTPTQE